MRGKEYIAWEVPAGNPKNMRVKVLKGGREMTKEVFSDFLDAVQGMSEDKEIDDYQKERRLNEARTKRKNK